jgi:hypothetical protein
MIFMAFTIVGLVPTKAKTQKIHQEEGGKAFTNINLTLSETDIIYERTTHSDPEEGREDVRRSMVVVTLTTHSDLLVNFNVEFFADIWNDNITLFNNSDRVRDYRNFYPLLDLVHEVDNVSLLEITRSSLRLEYINDSFFPNPFFVLDQSIILRQTTVFILALHEIFQFDLNKIELSQITDFNFQQEYFFFELSEERHTSESIRIKAPSRILDYVSNKKGYSGRIYFSNWEEPEPVPTYFRGFKDIPQDIRVNIKLPTGQNEISYKFDTNFTQVVSTSSLHMINSRNTLSMLFSSNSYLPFYIDIDSATPLLEQFSLSDYLSMAVGLFAGMFTFFKGLPYYLNRRSFNKYKKALHLATEKGTISEYESLQAEIKDKFIQRKISARQLEEIRKEILYLRRADERKKEQLETKDTKEINLEELLGRETS